MRRISTFKFQAIAEGALTLFCCREVHVFFSKALVAATRRVIVMPLGPERHNAIVAGLRGRLDKESPETYLGPNESRRAISAESVHLIFSQAVLEHIDDLESIYRNCFAWLRPRGLMSHQIDFKFHGMSHVWNGHWAYPDPVWKLIRGHRPYLIHRQPCGTYREALEKSGFCDLF
jgi:hypothetical protein